MTKGAAIRPFGDGGGAGVLDWQTHQDALRAHWLVRYIDNTRGHWKLLMDHWIFKNNNGPTDRASLLIPKIARNRAKQFPLGHAITKYMRNATIQFAIIGENFELKDTRHPKET